MHKNVHHRAHDVSGLWDLNEQKVEELLYFLVYVWSLRMTCIYRAGRKTWTKIAKFAFIGMWP